MGQQTSSPDRSAADRELVEKAEKSSLLTDTDDGQPSSPVGSPVGSPERVPAPVAPARPKLQAQDEASSSAATTVRTAAAVVSWMALNITIGNLNGWILKRHAFGYPVRTSRTPHALARACSRGLLSPPSRHHCATPSPRTPRTSRTPRTCAGRALLSVTLTLALTVLHAHLAP